MKPEAHENNDGDTNMREDNVGTETEQFDTSGSPAKEPDEEITIASRTATPSERRLRTPERNSATKRKTEFDHDASQKRLSMDIEDDVASIGDNVGVDMMFDDDGPSGAGGVADETMMGMFTELNIVDITEVFSLLPEWLCMA